MVLTVLVEQVAELLGIEAEDVDPRYSARRLNRARHGPSPGSQSVQAG